MDKKTHNRIISGLRSAWRFYPVRVAAKNAAKIDKALFECKTCGCYVYEGKSAISFSAYQIKYPEKKIIQDRAIVDHIIPVVDPTDTVNMSRNFEQFQYQVYIDRLFCGTDNLQIMCEPCHRLKTASERKQRLATKYGNKGK